MRAAAERVIADSATPTVHDLLALATACRHLNDLDAAADAAARARERDPASMEAVLTSAIIARDQGDGAAALSHFRDVARRDRTNPRWAIEVVWLLILLGRIAEAIDEMDAALERMPTDQALWSVAIEHGFRPIEQARSAGLSGLDEVVYARLVRAAPANPAMSRPIMVDDKRADAIVAQAAGANTGVMVFTGASDQCDLPLAVFDRYLAALGITAFYLKDFERLLYLNGVRSLGTSRTATLAALRQMQDLLAVERWCTIGSSDGGYAAIRYGVALGVERILCFDAPTHWAPDFDEFPVLSRRLAARFSRQDIDLKAYLATEQYSSEIVMCYGDKSPRDRAHASHLSGCKGVTLHPEPEVSDHGVLRWLALNKDLLAMLRGLLAISGPAVLEPGGRK